MNNSIPRLGQPHVSHAPNAFHVFAPLLIAAGYSAVPLAPGQKYPVLKDWTRFCTLPPVPPEIDAFPHGCGLGLPLGRFNVVIDVDNPVAAEVLLPMLPPTPVGKRGAKGFSLIYRQNSTTPVRLKRLPSKRDETGKRTMLVEVLSQGSQTVLPPSVHPDTGNPYIWFNPWTQQPSYALWDVPSCNLPEIPATIIDDLEAALVAAGLREDPAIALAHQAERRARQPQIKAEWEQNRHRFVPWLEKRLSNQAASLVNLTEDRQHNLYRAACAMAPYVAAGLIDEDHVRQTLFQACETNGFFDRERSLSIGSTRKEFDRQIDNAIAWGETQPLAPLPERYFTAMGEAPPLPAVPGAALPAPELPAVPARKMRLDDFYAYMPNGEFICRKDGGMWKGVSVDRSFPKIQVGTKPDKKGVLQPVLVPATTWIAQNAPIHQMGWIPGAPQTIENQRVKTKDWIPEPGWKIFNSYEAPRPHVFLGNWSKAKRWTDHIELLWPNEAREIIAYFAHAVQRPGEKCNHALFLGGHPGTGKDTILEPVIEAVGSWNSKEVSPEYILTAPFNEYLKTVILRVSEAKDLGDGRRFQLYEKMKTIIAAPPNVHLVNEKHVKEQAVVNVNRVIFTSNHLEGGLYLRSDDRRHLVCWSEVKMTDVPDLSSMWHWFLKERGLNDCAAYLKEYNLDGWDAKSPPRKTPAFFELVDNGKSNQASMLEDLLERMGWPLSTTIAQLAAMAGPTLGQWISSAENANQVVHMLRDASYSSVRNPHRKDGRWKITDRPVTVFVNNDRVPHDQRLIEAQRFSGVGNVIPLNAERR